MNKETVALLRSLIDRIASSTRRPSNIWITPPGHTPEDTAAVLLRAADWVQFRGWVQGTAAKNAEGYPVPPGSLMSVGECTAAALRVASGTFVIDPAAEHAFLDFIRRDSWWDSIARWNDAPDRTAGEAADTLRRCAKELVA